MKKVLFSFAVLAVVATMTACGNKSAQPVEGQDDATTSEQSTKAQPAEAAPTVALATTIDKETYTIGLPEGWSTLSANDKGCYMYKGDGKKPSEAVSGTFIIMQFQPSDGKTIEDGIKEAVDNMAAKQLDDVTFNGTTYKQLSYTEDGVDGRILVTTDGEQVISFMMARTTPDDPEIQAIINSFKKK